MKRLNWAVLPVLSICAMLAIAGCKGGSAAKTGMTVTPSGTIAIFPPAAPVIATPYNDASFEGQTSVNLNFSPPPGVYFSINVDRRDLIQSSSAGLSHQAAVSDNSAWSAWNTVATLPPSSTTFSDTSISCGNSYEYRVCTDNGNGKSCSPDVRVDGPICPPKDLTATLVSLGEVQLAWTDSSNNEQNFLIYRKTAPSGPFEQVGVVGANVTAWSDTNITCETKYMYKVRAANEERYSGYSNEASVTTGVCKPAAPISLSAVALNSSQIQLAWTDKSYNEDGFRIERAAAANGPFSVVGSVGANTTGFSDSGLNPLTTYFYRVSSFNAASSSDYSNVASATTAAVLTAAPAGFTKIKLTWTANASIGEGFGIERSTAEAGPFAVIASTSAGVSSYTDSGLSQGAVFYYRIRLLSPPEAPYSNVASASTQAAWYVDINATGLKTGISWKDAFTKVQDGVNAASAGQMIWVAQGTYLNTSAFATSEVVIMKAGNQLYGGFTATESDLSQRGNPADHPAILDGRNTSNHVVVGATDAMIDGFTIRGGYAQSGVPNYPWGGGGGGGGMFNIEIQNVTITNCIFTGNYSGRNGGGIFNIYTAGIVIHNCQFISNSTPKTKTSYGGGISDHEGNAIITNCLFKNNIAYYGGGFANGWYTGNMTNCVFIGNSASYGGGIDNYHSSGTYTNCTLSGNSAGGGGAFYIRSLFGTGDPAPTIRNSILWGNAASTGAEIYKASYLVPTVQYNDIKGGYAGINNISADPLFIGSPDLHLQSTSPCINAGTATGAPSDDFDGKPRPSGIGFDIGAYEYQ